MGIKQNLLKQFHKPTGVLGSLVGRVMSINNRERSNWTIEKLNSKPSDYILEIGFGSSSTFMRIAEKLTTGFIGGIDHSEVMLRQAESKNQKYIYENRAKMECGTVYDLNYPENYFDIIFGSNVHFFWKNPVEEFVELYSLLKPGGRLVMVFQPRWVKSEDQVKEVAEQTKKQFKEAGLKNIEIDLKTMKPVSCIFAAGQK